MFFISFDAQPWLKVNKMYLHHIAEIWWDTVKIYDKKLNVFFSCDILRCIR